ncbi:MAG TPA: transcriptional repressor LexA [Bacillota bacterium]|nr:transcriptional repressor LexA [Clostridiales bacterium]HOQ14271.1 transcriptional repressor LexA [Bacillota bacterium]
MKQPLAPKERAMYEYIAASIKQNGFAPSIRDISSALGIKSTSTVHTYLTRLEEKGYIQKEGGKSRTLRTSAPDANTGKSRVVRLPVIGRVTAGMPIYATEIYDEDDVIEVSIRGGYSESELFALRVSGDSMINAGIFDGDIIVARREPMADNGEIVVAMVDDEATVKRFYREDGRFRLQPENDAMDPIYADEVTILGRVIACVRYY